MPATYTHHYTWDQTQKRNRPFASRKAKEPEEYNILGFEVDASTYRKYNRQDYRVGFGFHGLRGVELWATDPDYVKRYPEEAAKAKKIMEKIIAGITGKDVNNMSTPKTAADFIAALNEIYAESRATYDALHGKVEAAKARMDNAYEEMRDPACKNRELAEAKYDVAKSEYKMLDFDRYGEYQNMEADYKSKVKNLREKFSSFLDEHYAASPDKLDTDTMQLLNSGICTADELARLVDQHSDNPTMIRIIGSHAKKMNDGTLSYADRAVCATVQNAAIAAADGRREMAIFDSAVSTTDRGLGKNYEVASKMHKHIPSWLEDFGNQIQNLPVTPVEISASSSNE